LASTLSSEPALSRRSGGEWGKRHAILAACAIVIVVPLAALGQQPSPQNRSVIELMNQLETLRADLNRLRGELEVLTNNLDNAQRRQRDMYLDLDTRMRRLESAGPEAVQKHDKTLADLDGRIKRLEEAASGGIGDLDARLKRLEASLAAPASGVAPASTASIAQPTPPTPPSVPRPAAPAAGADGSASRRAYESAFNLHRAGDFQGAVAAFEALIKRYPRDSLAPNAQYWVGDAWFNLRDFAAAARAQQALVANYPDSPKVPDAMLNLASAQVALGDSSAARKTLEDLISRYPQTEAAEKARQRLPKLR
jgi:tol-pal system protein YbgF